MLGGDDNLVVFGRARFERDEQTLDYRFVEHLTDLLGTARSVDGDRLWTPCPMTSAPSSATDRRRAVRRLPVRGGGGDVTDRFASAPYRLEAPDGGGST